MSLSHVANVFNPSHIVGGGDLVRLGPPLLDAIDAGLGNHSLPAIYRAVKLTEAELSEDIGAALGAATLVIDKVFEA